MLSSLANYVDSSSNRSSIIPSFDQQICQTNRNPNFCIISDMKVWNCLSRLLIFWHDILMLVVCLKCQEYADTQEAISYSFVPDAVSWSCCNVKTPDLAIPKWMSSLDFKCTCFLSKLFYCKDIYEIVFTGHSNKITSAGYLLTITDRNYFSSYGKS